MNISVSNFKSIKWLPEFEIKPLTILSGPNSSGKSSFIQLLLLLKQTIDIDSTKYPLFIHGELFSASNYIDLIRDKNKDNKLSIAFSITKSEFESFGSKVQKSLFDSFPDYTCTLNFSYEFRNENFIIDRFKLTYLTDEKSNFIEFEQGKNEAEELKIDSNNEYFLKFIYDTPVKYTQINYTSFFPVSVEATMYESIESSTPEETLFNERRSNIYPNIDSIKTFLQCFFDSIFYIGPLRVAPKDIYPSVKGVLTVGVNGEFVAQILEDKKDDKIPVMIPNFSDSGVEFTERTVSLLDAVNIWICQVFKFGKKIYTTQNGDNYAIIIENFSGVKTTIKHVGFGVSQVLPIIVQGILSKPNSVLILEQPEIHLHPKVQSYLFDFLYSIILQKKKIIIETHSDHFIMRMRRRIAEENDLKLEKLVNLTFIEREGEDISFREINLDEYGTLNFFPEEFIERPDIELKSLIKAQTKKRISTNRKE